MMVFLSQSNTPSIFRFIFLSETFNMFINLPFSIHLFTEVMVEDLGFELLWTFDPKYILLLISVSCICCYQRIFSVQDICIH